MGGLLTEQEEIDCIWERKMTELINNAHLGEDEEWRNPCSFVSTWGPAGMR